MQLSHYEQAPPQLQQQLATEYQEVARGRKRNVGAAALAPWRGTRGAGAAGRDARFARARRRAPARPSARRRDRRSAADSRGRPPRPSPAGSRARQPRRVDLPRVERRDLRHVAADEFARRIEALRLRHRVEDAEIRLRVAARRRRPLPAAVVRREIVVDQLVGEVALAPAPVDEQVLDEEGRRDHAQPVVHVARRVQLPHRGVDDRVARPPVAPRRERAGSSGKRSASYSGLNAWATTRG